MTAAAKRLRVNRAALSGWISEEPGVQRNPKAHERTMIEILYGVSRFAWETMEERGQRLVAEEEGARLPVEPFCRAS